MNADMFPAFTDNPWQRRKPTTDPAFAFPNPKCELGGRQQIIEAYTIGSLGFQTSFRTMIFVSH